MLRMGLVHAQALKWHICMIYEDLRLRLCRHRRPRSRRRRTWLGMPYRWHLDVLTVETISEEQNFHSEVNELASLYIVCFRNASALMTIVSRLSFLQM